MTKKRLTIEFNQAIAPLLKELKVCGFDTKDVANAGVLLFSRLSGDEQKQAIVEAQGQAVAQGQPKAIKSKVKSKQKPDDLEAALEKVKDAILPQPGVKVKVLSAEESRMVAEIRKAFAPTPEDVYADLVESVIDPSQPEDEQDLQRTLFRKMAPLLHEAVRQTKAAKARCAKPGRGKRARPASSA